MTVSEEEARLEAVLRIIMHGEGKDMDYCIVCKNKTEKRYMLELKDSRNSTGITAHVCRDCFNRFLSSHANEGVFRVSKFLGWAKGKDRIRE